MLAPLLSGLGFRKEDGPARPKNFQWLQMRIALVKLLLQQPTSCCWTSHHHLTSKPELAGGILSNYPYALS